VGQEIEPHNIAFRIQTTYDPIFDRDLLAYVLGIQNSDARISNLQEELNKINEMSLFKRLMECNTVELSLEGDYYDPLQTSFLKKMLRKDGDEVLWYYKKSDQTYHENLLKQLYFYNFKKEPFSFQAYKRFVQNSVQDGNKVIRPDTLKDFICSVLEDSYLSYVDWIFTQDNPQASVRKSSLEKMRIYFRNDSRHALFDHFVEIGKKASKVSTTIQSLMQLCYDENFNSGVIIMKCAAILSELSLVFTEQVKERIVQDNVLPKGDEPGPKKQKETVVKPKPAATTAPTKKRLVKPNGK
jgi:hypothetical protein